MFVIVVVFVVVVLAVVVVVVVVVVVIIAVVVRIKVAGIDAIINCFKPISTSNGGFPEVSTLT